MKTRPLLLLALCSLTLQAAENLVLELYQDANMGGCILHNANPGKSNEAIRHIMPFPREQVPVGPTENEGVSLAFLMAFKTTPEFRQHLASDGQVRLVLEVVKTLKGGAPDDLEVALLNVGTVTNRDHYPQFGAFNKAQDYRRIGGIDADAEAGLKELVASKALHSSSRQPSGDAPLIWFAVYLPVEKLEGTASRHVVFSGSPKLVGIR